MTVRHSACSSEVTVTWYSHPPSLHSLVIQRRFGPPPRCVITLSGISLVDQIFRQERLHHCHAEPRTRSSWGCNVPATSRCSRGPACSPHQIALGRAVKIERCSFIRARSPTHAVPQGHTRPKNRTNSRSPPCSSIRAEVTEGSAPKSPAASEYILRGDGSCTGRTRLSLHTKNVSLCMRRA